MIVKICGILTDKIKKEMPEIDEERAEIINYGLQNIVGEIPKIFIILIFAYFMGIFKETIITFLSILLYKNVSGGIHLKTHLGCMIMSICFYCIIPYVSKMIYITNDIKIILITLIWIFGIIMIKLYAPADTENVPIVSKKERDKRRILSYIIFTLDLIVALIVKDNIVSNIIIISNLIQTICLTRFIYKITNNRYGYEVYSETSN